MSSMVAQVTDIMALAARSSNETHYDAALHLEAGLVSRTMITPGAGMTAFYKEALVEPGFARVVFRDLHKSDQNTAVFEELRKDQGPKSLGVERLCGCTTLVIVSRSAVYITHWWEDLSFSPAEENWAPYGSVDACFEATVIKGLQEGIPGNNDPAAPNYRPAQVSLSAVAAQITAGGNVKAYLIHPTETFDSMDFPEHLDAYKEKWARIKDTVNSIIPGVQNSWTDIPYVALGNKASALRYTAGKLLFKYDPQNERADGNTFQKAALWFQKDTTDLHNDEWI